MKTASLGLLEVPGGDPPDPPLHSTLGNGFRYLGKGRLPRERIPFVR